MVLAILGSLCAIASLFAMFGPMFNNGKNTGPSMFKYAFGGEVELTYGTKTNISANPAVIFMFLLTIFILITAIVFWASSNSKSTRNGACGLLGVFSLIELIMGLMIPSILGTSVLSTLGGGCIAFVILNAVALFTYLYYFLTQSKSV